MYKTRRQSVIKNSNFSPLQNISQRPRRKNLQIVKFTKIAPQNSYFSNPLKKQGGAPGVREE